MEDLIHKLLVSSDSFLAKLRVEWDKYQLEDDTELTDFLTSYEKKDKIKKKAQYYFKRKLNTFVVKNIL